MIHHLLIVGINSGPDAAAATVKDWANTARLLALGSLNARRRGHRDDLRWFLRGTASPANMSPWALEVIAGVGRSLPAPIHSRKDPLKDLKSRLSATTQTSPEIISAFERFCREFAGRHLQKEPVFRVTALNTSACVERSRRHGGLEQEAKENAYRLWADEWALPQFTTRLDEGRIHEMFERDYLTGDPDDLDSFREVTEEQREYILRWALWRFRSTETPRAKVVNIPERGWKYRTATASPAHLQVLGGPLNNWLLNGLRRFEPTKCSLQGNFDPLPWFKSGTKEQSKYSWWRKKILRSADLSAASDWIPHDLAVAGWLSICKTCRIGGQWAQIGAQLLGPQSIELERDERFTSSRGILMGLPLTWPILSLINAFCAEHRTNEDGTRHWFYRSIRQRYAICGDDLAAIWTHKEDQMYNQNLHDCGLKVNQSKDSTAVLSPDSPRAGLVFTEKVYLLRYQRNFSPAYEASNPRSGRVHRSTLGRLRLSSLLRARLGTITRNLGLDLPGAGGERIKETPAVYALGPSLREAVSDCKPYQRRIALRVAERYHQTTLDKMRATKIPLYVPETLGGWGVPHPKGERAGFSSSPRRFRKALSVALVNDNWKAINALRQHFVFTAPSQDSEVIDNFISLQRKSWGIGKCTKMQLKKLASVRPSDVILTMPNGEIGYHASSTDRALRQDIGGLLALNNRSSRRPGTLRYLPRTLGKRFSRSCSRLLSSWQSVKPIRHSKAVKLLSELEKSTFYLAPKRAAWLERSIFGAEVPLPRALDGPVKPPGKA